MQTLKLSNMKNVRVIDTLKVNGILFKAIRVKQFLVALKPTNHKVFMKHEAQLGLLWYDSDGVVVGEATVFADAEIKPRAKVWEFAL